LAQGLSPSPEIWQSRINAALAGLKGVFCIAGDILITESGADIATAERGHDNNLQALLDRCRARNLKLNKAKFQLRQTSMTFMEHELTSSGLRPDQRKIKATEEMPIPADKPALQRFLALQHS